MNREWSMVNNSKPSYIKKVGIKKAGHYIRLFIFLLLAK